MSYISLITNYSTNSEKQRFIYLFMMDYQQLVSICCEMTCDRCVRGTSVELEQPFVLIWCMNK